MAVVFLPINVSLSQTLQDEGGFVILKSSQKKNGVVSFNPSKSPGEVVFLDPLTSAVTTYSTTELEGFGTDSGLYFIENINIAKNQFTQILFQGDISLYAVGKNLLLELKNNELLELVNPEGDRNKIIKNLGTLSFVTTGQCNPTTKVALKSFVYKEENLIQLLEQFHKCENSPYNKYYYNYKLAVINILFGVGLNASGISDGQGSSSPIEISSSKTISPSLTFGLSASNIIRIPKKYFADILFSYNSYEKELMSRTIDQTNLYIGSINYKLSTLESAFILNYNLIKNDNHQTYFGVGVQHSYNFIDQDFSLVNTELSMTNEIIVREITWHEIKKSTISPVAKIGYRKQLTPKNQLVTELNVSRVFSSENILLSTMSSTYHRLNGRLLLGITF